MRNHSQDMARPLTNRDIVIFWNRMRTHRVKIVMTLYLLIHSGLWRLTVVLFKATSIIEAPGLAAAARGLSGLGSSED
uniref:Uncharacterized protein n=1 Tax=Oryza meridionalis TaxID=40149 RepID=A0A0E0EBE7_9ORYZ